MDILNLCTLNAALEIIIIMYCYGPSVDGRQGM